MTPQSPGSPLKGLRRYQSFGHALSGSVCPSRARFQSWVIMPVLSFLELPSCLEPIIEVPPEAEVNVGQVSVSVLLCDPTLCPKCSALGQLGDSGSSPALRASR